MSRLRRSTLAVLCVLVAAPSAALADATPDWFTLPDDRNVGPGIVADPDGTVWFAGEMSGAETAPPIGRPTPAQAVPGTTSGIAYFPTPAVVGEGCCTNFIRGMAYDAAKGRVWFVRSTGVFGYGRTAAMVPGTEAGFSVGQTSTPLDLGGVALKADGTAWITEYDTTNALASWPGNRIAFTDESLGLTEFPNLADQDPGFRDQTRYDAKPKGVTVDRDGAVWFTESDSGNAGYRIAKAVPPGGYQEYDVTPCVSTNPCSGSYGNTGPLDIAAAPDGTIWFTNQINNSVGRLDPAAGTITQYALPAIDPTLAAGQPRAIRLARDGTLWVAEFGFISHPGANAIIRIVPTGPPTATVYKLGAGKAPLAVAPDTKGNVWFTATGDTQPDFVGRLADVVGEPAPPAGPGVAPPPPGGTVVKPASVATAKIGDPKVHGKSVRVSQICVGPPADRCSLIYLIESNEYVKGFPGTRASAAGERRKTRRVVVGSKTVTLHGGQRRTVAIKLNAKGRKILKRDGKLNATLRVTRKVAGGKPKKLKTKKLVFKSQS